MTEPVLRVSEYFTSLQGEGIYAGHPMTFLRFVGCNLKCEWCDSKYASKAPANSTDYTEERVHKLVGSILDILPSVPKRRLCMTGGEPTIQSDYLMDLFFLTLLDHDQSEGRGVDFHLETNGIVVPDWIEEWIDWATVSPKPSDPEMLTRDYSWADELKVVLVPGHEIPRFTGLLPEHLLVMPMTKQPFAKNIDFNIKSYGWAAEQVLLRASEGWVLTGRFQELGGIR